MGVGVMVSPNIIKLGSHFLPLDLTFYELQSRMGILPKPLSEIILGDLTLDALQVLFNSFDDPCKPHHLIPKLSSSPVPSMLFGNLNGPLSKITVEEIWRQIGFLRVNENNHTLAETTVKNFFLQVNMLCDMCDNQDNHNNVVVDSKPVLAMDPTSLMPQGDQLHQQQQTTIADSDFVLPETLYDYENSNEGYSDNQLAMQADMIFTTNSGCHTTFDHAPMFDPMLTDEEIETLKEKKLKRMMKNRESAARSRAKKQAYTNHLEQQKSILTKKNMDLTKEVALLRLNLASQPLCQLRRSNSLPATMAQLAAIYGVPSPTMVQ